MRREQRRRSQPRGDGMHADGVVVDAEAVGRVCVPQRRRRRTLLGEEHWLRLAAAPHLLQLAQWPRLAAAAPMDLEEATEMCIASLPDPEQMTQPLTRVVQLVVDAVHRGDRPATARAMQVLFDVSCSGSGTKVLVERAASHAAGVAVLLLGYAGSALSIFGPQVSLYQRLGMKVVATVASGLCDYKAAEAAFDAQCERVILALAGVKKIVVHCMSNNGQGLWAMLLHKKGHALRSRVAAVVYDCAAARPIKAIRAEAVDDASLFDSLESFAHVVKSTVFLPLIQHRVEVSAPDGSEQPLTMRHGSLRGPIETAAKYLVEWLASHNTVNDNFWASRARPSGLSVQEYDARHCPFVPVLCLTTPDDLVISREAVVDWYEYLVEASGGCRDVQLEVADSGSHCMIAQRHKDFYEAAIAAFVGRAGLNDEQAPIKIAHGRGSEEASPLAALLEPAGLGHLSALFSACQLDLDGLCQQYASAGRVQFIAMCKDKVGVPNLSERQRIANVIAKRVKEQ
ncbi:hypothetical protein AB1Y20_003941 [Prymnesium parvum]|uniref:Uncharacterized protein n=1 Tax=Prymnesium parvum TaxID=97485 RepID=A0AB34J6N2_PRYPA